ncbi:hypothetical protein PT23B2_12670 [Acinetobacter towneri]
MTNYKMEKEQALEFEKLLKNLEKSKTVRTADLRSKNVRQFMRENVHFEGDLWYELLERREAAYKAAIANIFK